MLQGKKLLTQICILRNLHPDKVYCAFFDKHTMCTKTLGRKFFLTHDANLTMSKSVIRLLRTRARISPKSSSQSLNEVLDFNAEFSLPSRKPFDVNKSVEPKVSDMFKKSLSDGKLQISEAKSKLKTGMDVAKQMRQNRTAKVKKEK